VTTSRKKDHVRTQKKRRRMREAIASRKAHTAPASEQRDEIDKIKFKPGSGSDRNQRARAGGAR
jgi:hypothetical protein